MDTTKHNEIRMDRAARSCCLCLVLYFIIGALAIIYLILKLIL